jgi:hypothetical protein
VQSMLRAELVDVVHSTPRTAVADAPADVSYGQKRTPSRRPLEDRCGRGGENLKTASVAIRIFSNLPPIDAIWVDDGVWKWRDVRGWVCNVRLARGRERN